MNVRLVFIAVVLIATIAAVLVVLTRHRNEVAHGRFEQRLRPTMPHAKPRPEDEIAVARAEGIGSIQQLREVEIEAK